MDIAIPVMLFCVYILVGTYVVEAYDKRNEYELINKFDEPLYAFAFLFVLFLIWPYFMWKLYK